MKLKSPLLVKPRSRVELSHLKSNETGGFKSPESAAPVLVKHRDHLAKLQEILYAGQQHALLLVLQGMDTAGKDGTVQHIFSGINPQGCQVASFKVPTPIEARHDFLWRVHAQVPPRGVIGIFNRSHYEDVLSPRVHKLIPKAVVKDRLDRIKAFEDGLVQDGVVILKFFLHISREEQTERLQARIDTPDKHWKLSEADFKERQFWPQYQEAYEEILSKTSQKHAPWFIIPSDHKWFRNIAISGILVDVMKGLNLSYPKATFDPRKVDLHGIDPHPSRRRKREKRAEPTAASKS